MDEQSSILIAAGEVRNVSRAAVLMSLTRSREEERQLKERLMAEEGAHCAAVDFGGEFVASIMKIVERSVVAAKREGVIVAEYKEEGCVAGAAHEALKQVLDKALGLNVGGKIGIARKDNNVAVAVFLGIGLLHLNDVAIGLGHRAI